MTKCTIQFTIILKNESMFQHYFKITVTIYFLQLSKSLYVYTYMENALTIKQNLRLLIKPKYNKLNRVSTLNSFNKYKKYQIIFFVKSTKLVSAVRIMAILLTRHYNYLIQRVVGKSLF